MKKIVIFGAGGTGRKLYEKLSQDTTVKILAFADNFKTGKLFGLDILRPEQLKQMEYDALYIASVHADAILSALLEMGLDENKIVCSLYSGNEDARVIFLKNFAGEIYRRGIEGHVAEAGVFRGDFAKQINNFFPDRKLYLFDTFKGFDERDTAIEAGYEKNPGRGEYFKETSVDLVLNKMPHRENIIVKKGYVPESFEGVDDTFCFINLDMDLRQPTVEALKFFYPRIVRGGGILVHDYFDETGTYPNLKLGVIEFVNEVGARCFPIGDGLSVFIPA